MACTQLLEAMGNTLEWADYLVYPTTCFYYFWAVIFFGLFVLIAFFLFNREREDLVKPDLISSLGVSATAILLLAVIATLIESGNGIPMLQSDIFLYIIAFWIVIVGFWYFKK